ncbi:hypothetical protein IRY61_03505 [Candidatus Saccharibacteria bacterium]|nr:hypothetical protein [Candidatus Saccharibacteria bacterium]
MFDPKQLGVCLLVGLVSAPVLSAEPKNEVLFCTGQSDLVVGQNQLTETTAFLEVGARTYIEVYGVGHGVSPGKPKMLSPMTANMAVNLKSAYEGGPELSAQFSLNIYSGQLAVIYFDKENKMRSAFQGVCKKAEPLLKL